VGADEVTVGRDQLAGRLASVLVICLEITRYKRLVAMTALVRVAPVSVVQYSCVELRFVLVRFVLVRFA
jgi:hypothetical protein